MKVRFNILSLNEEREKYVGNAQMFQELKDYCQVRRFYINDEEAYSKGKLNESVILEESCNCGRIASAVNGCLYLRKE